MCRYCLEWRPQSGSGSHRDFLLASSAAGVAAQASNYLAVGVAGAHELPAETGKAGQKILIRGGAVLSMDPAVGDFEEADVLVDGRTIAAVGPALEAGDAQIVDARGMIVMPGFIDTHHHLFETALRSFLADGILVNDGQPQGAVNYYEYILQKFSMVYRPEDVYINELFGSLAQLDAGSPP